MEQLAWSDGSKPIRSRKEDKPNLSRPETGTEQQNMSAKQEHERDIMGQAIFRQPNTSREDANDKISEREMIGQTCQNPFFTSTSYVEDLVVQQNFLMPQSSHNKVNE